MTSTPTPARRALDTALDLLFPRQCGGCGTYGAGYWCPDCDARAARFDAAAARGSLPLPDGQLTLISAAPFESPLREAIHAFKFNGTPHLADVFADWMRAAWESAADPGSRVDVVAPVPLHRARERERGYNQSEWLARRIARALNARCEKRALSRVRATDQQALLSPAQRLANVRDAFSADQRLLHGQRVLIIDDVLTTGATIAECARAAARAGAIEITALTLARAADSR